MKKRYRSLWLAIVLFFLFLLLPAEIRAAGNASLTLEQTSCPKYEVTPTPEITQTPSQEDITPPGTPLSGGSNTPDDSNSSGSPETSEGSKLPQTGQLWWPVSVLAGVGILFCLVGILLRKNDKKDDKKDE